MARLSDRQQRERRLDGFPVGEPHAGQATVLAFERFGLRTRRDLNSHLLQFPADQRREVRPQPFLARRGAAHDEADGNTGLRQGCGGLNPDEAASHDKAAAGVVGGIEDRLRVLGRAQRHHALELRAREIEPPRRRSRCGEAQVVRHRLAGPEADVAQVRHDRPTSSPKRTVTPMHSSSSRSIRRIAVRAAVPRRKSLERVVRS
jgi:hypothetical protein